MTNKTKRYNFIAKPCLISAMLVFLCLQLWVMPASADEKNLLKPIDTSSPRATFQGFIEFMNQAYEMGPGLVDPYLASSNLYLTPEDLANLQGAVHYQKLAQRALDLSEVPLAMADESARRFAVQLKEVLDHIDLPPIESIPDAQAMSKSEFKRWTLPNCEIQLRRVETGPRAGEYLFASETLRRLPEFYAQVKNLPYKPGATAGWYNFASYSPVGIALALHSIFPPRWIINPLHQKAPATFLDQPAWRWIGILVILGTGLVFVLLCFRFSHRWVGQASFAERWAYLICPLSLVIVSPLAALVLADALRISGTVYQVLTLSLWALFYLSLTWTVWVAGGAVAASLIAGEKLLATSIDSQLIRLVTRLVTFIAAIFILVSGADRVGLPAYSVLAGLGVGGLAVALAAQQTIANLIGSLIIMFERPFAVGESIKLKDTEGTVENVGFRSTRIRTPYNSLVTIPSSLLVNSTIDNMALREYRQVNTILNLTYDTPAEMIESFVEGIKKILETHADTQKDNIQVFLYEFGAHSLDVMLNFFLKVPDRHTELIERQRIFLDILRLAEAEDVHFAFPTQTLHIQSLAGENPTIVGSDSPQPITRATV